MSDPAWAPELERFCGEMMAEHRVPGLSLAVAQDGRPVYERGFGRRDVAGGLPAAPTTVYGIGSITKGFTAIAILQLQESGKLSVHDPVTRHLPEYRVPDETALRRTRLHHLLTHTAGLPPLPSRRLALARSGALDPLAPGEQPIDTFEQLLAFIGRHPFELLAPPGRLFSYSNDGFALLGAVVERVSGEPYTEYVAGHILGPAGMHGTTFSVEAAMAAPDVTTLYASRGSGAGKEIHPSPVWEAGAVWDPPGGLKSTVGDLLRYLEIYRTGGTVAGTRILQPESVATMVRRHVLLAEAGHPPFPLGAGYGYGLSVRRRPDEVRLIGHGGGRKGVSAHVLIAPDRGVSGAVLSNLGGVPAARVLEAALDGQMGLPVGAPPPEPPTVATTAERLAPLAGSYVSGEGAATVVAAEGGQLWITLQGERKPARPVAADTFALDAGWRQAFCRFLRDGDGRGRAMTVGLRIVPRASEA